jgi:hypothetical protein
MEQFAVFKVFLSVILCIGTIWAFLIAFFIIAYYLDSKNECEPTDFLPESINIKKRKNSASSKSPS